jgi:hypothetical protein
MRRRRGQPAPQRYTIQGYCTKELYDCLDKLADIDRRSLSEEVVMAAEEYCKRRKAELSGKKAELRREA